MSRFPTPLLIGAWCLELLAVGVALALAARTAPPSPAVLLPSDPASAAEPLTGYWEAMRRSTGGIGGTYEFRADGTLSYSLGAMVDQSYRVEGGVIRIPGTDPSGGDQVEYRLEGDSLVPATAGAPPLQRMGSALPGRAPVVGWWRRDAGETAAASVALSATEAKGAAAISETTRIILTDQGLFLTRVPLRTWSGTYHLQGDRLTIEAQGPVTVAEIEIVGDALTLTPLREGAQPEIFRRPAWVSVPLPDGEALMARFAGVGDRPPGAPIHRVQPDAAAFQEAVRAGAQGEVVVEARVDAEGNVLDVVVVQPLHPALDRATADAVKQWRFEPQLSGGAEIKKVRVSFSTRPPEASRARSGPPSFLEGWKLFYTDRMAEARDAFRAALREEPDHAQSHNMLGRTLVNTGDYEGARRHLQRFLELAPADPEAGTAREMLRHLP